MIQLADFDKKKIIFNDRITRSAYARDASMYRMVPRSVIKPQNVEDVKLIFQYANKNKTPLTFRAGGTSLSGQSVTDGILVEILHNWKKYSVLDNGKLILLEPGVIGAQANNLLSTFSRRLGPDPASIKSATIGGILSNNSSGMVCGTEFNSYHTIDSLSFILPNGNSYDTSKSGENQKFIKREKEITETLKSIQQTIKTNPELKRKIRDKYRIKNTIGYSMNAFLDFEKPLDIFSHLLIGSEGTLAFISSCIMNTVPNPEYFGTGLFIFNDSKAAGSTISQFKDLGASAIEFLDDKSLKTARHYKNIPYDTNLIDDNDVGILIEYQNDDINNILSFLKKTKQSLKKNRSIKSTLLVTDDKKREAIWKIRKGLYPTIGALRRTGESVITEDIAIDYTNLSSAVDELKNIFTKRNFDDSVIFGHAKDGNLHFVTSVDFNSQEGIDNYGELMNDLAKMTLQKFNGSLKAEHGTGRNMAPFVESEWGGEIYKLMWNLKESVDPNNILNPDVLLSKKQNIHISNIKKTPQISSIIDDCVECGFCETICPSRGLTFTPRQRIGIMREIKQLDLTKTEKDILNYGVYDTCATDGLCAVECPVNIDTGSFIKEIRRSKKTNKLFNKIFIEHFKWMLTFLKLGLRMINSLRFFFGSQNFIFISKKLNILSKNLIPVFPRNGFNISKKNYKNHISNPDYILFESCVNRVISGDDAGITSSEYLVGIAKNAGLKILKINDSSDFCCGLPFSSKGYIESANMMQNLLLDKLEEIYSYYRKPIIVDMSPCSEALYSKLKIKNILLLDSVEFLNTIKSKLEIKKLNKSFFVHTVCSTQKSVDNDSLINLVKDCVENIETLDEFFCCGMGGDRGLKFPELSKNAINQSVQIPLKSSIGVSSSRTCEIGLSNELGLKFISIESLVYKVIKN